MIIYVRYGVGAELEFYNLGELADFLRTHLLDVTQVTLIPEKDDKLCVWSKAQGEYTFSIGFFYVGSIEK